MPFGIHRLSAGIVASASAPIAASSPLHSAIAWTVPMWLCTRRRLGITSSAWLGRMTVKRGRMVAKYGARCEHEREHASADDRPDHGEPAEPLPHREDLGHALDATCG